GRCPDPHAGDGASAPPADDGDGARAAGAAAHAPAGHRRAERVAAGARDLRLAPAPQSAGRRGPGRLGPPSPFPWTHSAGGGAQQGREPARAPRVDPARLGVAAVSTPERVESVVPGPLRPWAGPHAARGDRGSGPPVVYRPVAVRCLRGRPRRRSAAGSLSGLPRLRNTENTEAPMIATGWSSRSTGAWVEPHSTVLTEGAACPRGFRCALGACSIRCLTGQVSTDRRWSRRLPPPLRNPANPHSALMPHSKTET